MAPERVQGLQPVKEFRLASHALCKTLIHVVMGVDKAGNEDAVAHILDDMIGIGQRGGDMFVLAHPLNNAIVDEDGTASLYCVAVSGPEQSDVLEKNFLRGR